MKKLINILILLSVLLFSACELNAQNIESLYLNSDSDTLKPGSIYLINLITGDEYWGKAVKIDSVYVLFKDIENETRKIRIISINKCLNIFTNKIFQGFSDYFWIIVLKSGAYYDSVTVKGSLIDKDTIRFRKLNNKEVKVPLKKVDCVEIYNNFHGELESDPMNMCFLYLIFSRSSVNTKEYDLSGYSNIWKAAGIKYLIYRYR